MSEALINWLKDAQCLEYRGTAGSIYGGPAPFDFDNTPEGRAALTQRPWVVSHINMQGRLWRARNVETFAIQHIRAGTPIAIHFMEEWKDNV